MIPFSFQLQNGDKGFVWLHEEGETHYHFTWERAGEPEDLSFYSEKRPKYSMISFKGFMEQLCFAIEQIYDCNSFEYQRKGAFRSELTSAHINEITFGFHKIDSTASLHAALMDVIANHSLTSEAPLFAISLNVRFAPMQKVKSAEEKTLVTNCNRLSLINACLLQTLANYSLNYGRAAYDERTMEKVEWLAGWQSSLKRMFTTSTFSGHLNISMAVGKLLSLYGDNNGRELLLVDDKLLKDGIIDWDLANVIEMVVNRHHNKNSYCLVLISLFFPALSVCSELLATKLSFLCHGGNQKTPFYNIKKMGFLATLAKSMPVLDTIVLRQCFASGDYAPDAIKFDSEFFKPRHIQLVGKHEDIEAKDLQRCHFLFQQKKTMDGQILTHVRYYDINGSMVTESLNTIPANLAAPAISMDVERALALQAKSHNWPPLDLCANKKAIDNIYQSWKNNSPLSADDKALYKASNAKARTFAVKDFPVENAASALLQQLEHRRNGISVKAYFGCYHSFFPCVGAINASKHGYKDKPKALCVSSSP